MTVLAGNLATPSTQVSAALIEQARSAVRVAEIRAASAERLATVCERRARLASGKAPMFLVEANRLRAEAERQIGEARRGLAARIGRSASYPGTAYDMSSR
jgi:hypothetical protein